MDYCNTVLAGAPKSLTDQLQRVLNAAARVVSNTRKHDHGLSELLHDELHWLDVPQRVDCKLCVTVHRCLQHKAPPYLADLCTPVSDIAGRQHLRSARSNQLDVPRHRRTQFGRRAFSVAGPMAWNALPDSIRDTALSICSFRRHLKTLLLVLAHQRIRGFAFMRYINPRLTLTFHFHYPRIAFTDSRTTFRDRLLFVFKKLFR